MRGSRCSRALARQSLEPKGAAASAVRFRRRTFSLQRPTHPRRQATTASSPPSKKPFSPLSRPTARPWRDALRVTWRLTGLLHDASEALAGQGNKSLPGTPHAKKHVLETYELRGGRGNTICETVFLGSHSASRKRCLRKLRIWPCNNSKTLGSYFCLSKATSDAHSHVHHKALPAMNERPSHLV